MANPELVKVMDYILNRCNERDIEVLAAAVIRRRRDLALFGNTRNMPDPKQMAQNMATQMNLEGTISNLRESVREFAVRVIRQEAPELNDEQVEELTRAWIPDGGDNAANADLPPDLLAGMITQFVAFSRGEMDEEEDASLREQFGAWPERYWKAFPQVMRLIITDYLKDEMDDEEFNLRLDTAMKMRGGG
jgi:hypothetical protein